MTSQSLGLAGSARPAYSVAVVGAGIVGLSIALRLMLDGCQVTVFDQAEPMSGCSAGNAGYLSEANIFPPASLEILKRLPQLMLAKDSPLVIQPAYVPQLIRWALPALKFNSKERLADIATSMAALLRVAYRSFEELVTQAGAAHLLDRQGGLVVYKTQAALEEKARNAAPLR